MNSIEEEDQKLLQGGRINLSDTQSNPSAHNSKISMDAQKAKKKKVIKWSIIGGSVAAAIILAIVLIVVLSKKSATPSPDNPPEPDPPGPPGPMPVYPTYNPYKPAGQPTNNGDSIQGTIKAAEKYNGRLHASAFQSLLSENYTDAHNYTINPAGIPSGKNNEFIEEISYYFGVVDYYTGYLKMTDSKNKRFEIPQEVQETKTQNPTMKTDMLGFKVLTDPTFGFELVDQLDPTNVLISTYNSTLVFMDKYLQIDFLLPSQKLYGLGDREHGFALGEGTWTMWAKENIGAATSPEGTFWDNGAGGLQGQSVHPFILIQTKNPGDYIGVYFRNSNAQSPMIKFKDDGTSSLSYITTGGILEMFFIVHGPAKTVIQVYHNIIGKPTLPPFWALGWGQAATPYKELKTISYVVDQYEWANIPLNTIYLDLHSLANYSNFEINTKDFSKLSNFVHGLHENKKMQIVALVEAGLSADDLENKYYKRAQELKILIQSSINKDKFEGALSFQAQNNHDVYIDWLHPNAQILLSEGLLDYYRQVEFDGLWLDKNAPSGFCNGECPDAKQQSVQQQSFLQKEGHSVSAAVDPYEGWFKSYRDQDQVSTYNLPFIPGYSEGGNLDTNTLSLNATHPSTGMTEYDLHNLFGLMMAEQTYSFLAYNQAYKKSDNRPFVLSRNTFPTSGKYSSHFVSTKRSWTDMKYSIASLMNFNMYGIPHTGSDVCGYYGTEYGEELCARWIQLATFYPLARINYQTLTTKDQKGHEPYSLTGNWFDIAKDSIHDRYQYLRFMYTCLYQVSVDGGSCIEPLLFEYPRDTNTLQNIEESFLVGGALKVSPILTKGVTDTYTSYFPTGRWVNLRDFSEIEDGNGVFTLKARNTVNVHLRPGALIPFQDNKAQTVKNTDSLLEMPITIIANRDHSKVSQGSVYLAKGLSSDEAKDNHHEHYKISVQANTMQKFLISGTHGSQKAHFDKLIIVDADDLQDVDFACYFDSHFNVQPMTVKYSAADKSLHIETEEPVIFSKFRQINFGSSARKELNLCDPTSFQYVLKDEEKGVDYSKNSTSFVVTHFAKTLPDLRVNISLTNANTVNVKWTFADTSDVNPFQIPAEIINASSSISGQILKDYVNVIHTSNYFAIQILNKNRDVVHSIDYIAFDKLLNIYGSQSNTTDGEDFNGIFGLGERVNGNKKIFYDDGVYSMWATDQPGLPTEDGRPHGKNTYGMHPFYMYKNHKDIWVGVFTKLAAAQDWYVKNYPDTGLVETTMVSVGGIADIYFIVDSSPSLVVSSYLDIVGKPIMPPFWALGWHQSRWGYKTTDDLKAVVKGYQDAKIPLDTMWSDIDYMDNYRDFTIDNNRYGDLAKFVKDLHVGGMKYVPIIDAGIAMRDGYKAFVDGVADDVFLKVRDQLLVGAVWPKEAVFPDWWAANTAKWWFNQLAHLLKQVEFDGLWEDMNEATNFCSGACTSTQMMNPAVKSMIKYTPTGQDLEHLSIPLNTRHQNGYLEFDTHSLFGIMEVKTTYDWFKSKQNRPFILSRSSFAGLGKYGFKWLGDNDSTATSMGQSVLGIMMMNIFGIPFSGSDICGFGGGTQPELCARWHVVGSFQPFTRNHNVYGAPSQEPFVFSKDVYENGDDGKDPVTYTDIMRTAIVNRYHLNNYYYTQLYLMGKNSGPVYKPLFFDYPEDQNTYQNQTDNVMIGDSFKLGVLSSEVGKNESEFYFPAGTWCNVFNGSEPCFTTKGVTQTRRTKAYDFYLHLKEGKVVPIVNATKYKEMNTRDFQDDAPIDFHILGKKLPFPENTWGATGKYYNDDSTLEREDDTGYFNLYEIQASATYTDTKNQIIIKVDQKNVATDHQLGEPDENIAGINGNDFLGQIYIYNAKALQASTKKYTTVLHYLNKTEKIQGKTTYLEDIDRLVIDVTDIKPCLTSLSHITLS